MSLFERVFDQLVENQRVRLAGGYTCLPFENLPKFSKVIPGVQRRKYVICTANSKVGKTQLADFLYMYEPLEFIRQNPGKLDLHIFYFSLELSKEEKMKQAISRQLFVNNGIRLSPEKLNSVFKDYILEESVTEAIRTNADYFKFLESHVTFIDNVRNPYGIYEYMRKYAEENGDYYAKDGSRIPKDLVRSRDYALNIDHYIPHNPDKYIIVITDHVSLLTPERGASLHQAISDFSSNYCLKMRDRWGYTIVNIQQQAADQEKQQFTMGGKSIIDKLRPSPDGLGDNKLTGRDCDLMLGLFAPYRYKIPEYAGYDIATLGDSYRELSILLNRSGASFLNLHLAFDGALNVFKELPKPEELEYSKPLFTTK